MADGVAREEDGGEKEGLESLLSGSSPGDFRVKRAVRPESVCLPDCPRVAPVGACT